MQKQPATALFNNRANDVGWISHCEMQQTTKKVKIVLSQVMANRTSSKVREAEAGNTCNLTRQYCLYYAYIFINSYNLSELIDIGAMHNFISL